MSPKMTQGSFTSCHMTAFRIYCQGAVLGGGLFGSVLGLGKSGALFFLRQGQ
jgi:hypothetical protein